MLFSKARAKVVHAEAPLSGVAQEHLVVNGTGHGLGANIPAGGAQPRLESSIQPESVILVFVRNFPISVQLIG